MSSNKVPWWRVVVGVSLFIVTIVLVSCAATSQSSKGFPIIENGVVLCVPEVVPNSNKCIARNYDTEYGFVCYHQMDNGGLECFKVDDE